MTNIPNGFINDGKYKCEQCEESMMCFSTGGETQFCPCCGSRSDEFLEVGDE